MGDPLAAGGWELVRIDIRSTATPGGWPMARVELRHPTRGRITDIASCEGHLDCVFGAIGRILGQPASVRSLDVRSTEDGGQRQATATIVVEVGAHAYRGVGTSGDVLESCALAYLNALGGLPADRISPDTL